MHDHPQEILIRDLGLIGNRRTAAAVSRTGSICWYCPGRFDRPTLFASLLDAGVGDWRFEVGTVEESTRSYLGESAVLRTSLGTAAGTWTITDWMTMDSPQDVLCRELDAAPDDVRWW